MSHKDATLASASAGLPAIESSAPAAHALRSLHTAAVRAEYFVSWLRAPFCALIVVRFLWIHAVAWDERVDPNGWGRGAISLPTMSCGFAFSLWMLTAIRRGAPISIERLRVSVLTDAVVCTVALSSNVLWPWPEYQGVLHLPETITFVALLLLAGFRVLPQLVVLGTASSAAGFAGLVGLDVALNGARVVAHPWQLLLYGLFMGCAAALAYASARRTERLTLEAAFYGQATSRARARFSSVLQGHHDALGFLSAALFGVHELTRDPSNSTLVDGLRTDLARLQQAIVDLKEVALAEATALGDPEPVDLVEVVSQAKQTCERAVAPMQMEWEIAEGPAMGVVVGGAKTMRRILLNLLLNAKEGDGIVGAAGAVVKIGRDRDGVRLTVTDDGPGLPAGWRGESCKARGTGSGIRFVTTAVEASGGRVHFAPTGAGTAVTVRLPAAN